MHLVQLVTDGRSRGNSQFLSKVKSISYPATQKLSYLAFLLKIDSALVVTSISKSQLDFVQRYQNVLKLATSQSGQDFSDAVYSLWAHLQLEEVPVCEQAALLHTMSGFLSLRMLNKHKACKFDRFNVPFYGACLAVFTCLLSALSQVKHLTELCHLTSSKIFQLKEPKK